LSFARGLHTMGSRRRLVKAPPLVDLKKAKRLTGKHVWTKLVQMGTRIR
jgi:hypothetical protein